MAPCTKHNRCRTFVPSPSWGFLSMHRRNKNVVPTGPSVGLFDSHRRNGPSVASDATSPTAVD
eukprot:scaffold5885_cov201-Amphora_coffeaeformis.AAC.3